MVADRRLRSRLREPAPPSRPRGDAHGRAARSDVPRRRPDAVAPGPAARLRRPGAARARRTARRRRRAPARCASASARSASTSSTSTCAAAGCRSCCRCPTRRPACSAWRRPAPWSTPAKASASLLPGDRVAYLGPMPGAYCERAHRAGRLGRATAVGDRRRDRRGAAAEGHHGRLPAARPRPRRAPARGCSCMRRPAASACSCAPGRGASARTVLGTVSSEEKARVARDHGCEHVIVTRDYRFAEAVQREARRRRRHRRWPRRSGARREPRGARARAATGSASARPAARCSRSRRTGWCRSRPPSRARSCSTTPRRRRCCAERAQRVWDALAAGTLSARRSSAIALDAARAGARAARIARVGRRPRSRRLRSHVGRNRAARRCAGGPEDRTGPTA